MILDYEVKDNKKNINQIIQEHFNLSNRLLSKLINNKRIFLNGNIVDTRLSPTNGDRITIDLDYYEENDNIVSKKIKLNILYEDEGLLVLNKPSGIAVHPSIRHYEDTLANGVKYYFESKKIYKKIRPVNRLDLNTSGIVIFAKNEYIQECLIRQMKENIFIKEYICIAKGRIEPCKGIIEAPIARKPGSIIERCISKEGKNAITKYEVLRYFNNACLIKCYLITGRTHQIRIHLANIGHPLLGDTLYGTYSNLIGRQALHCYKISFINPINSKKNSICADIPEDLLQVNSFLEKL